MCFCASYEWPGGAMGMVLPCSCLFLPLKWVDYFSLQYNEEFLPLLGPLRLAPLCNSPTNVNSTGSLTQSSVLTVILNTATTTPPQFLPVQIIHPGQY